MALRSSCFYCNHSDVDGHAAGHGKRAPTFSILMRRESPFAAIGQVVLKGFIVVLIWSLVMLFSAAVVVVKGTAGILMG